MQRIPNADYITVVATFDPCALSREGSGENNNAIRLNEPETLRVIVSFIRFLLVAVP